MAYKVDLGLLKHIFGAFKRPILACDRCAMCETHIKPFHRAYNFKPNLLKRILHLHDVVAGNIHGPSRPLVSLLGSPQVLTTRHLTNSKKLAYLAVEYTLSHSQKQTSFFNGEVDILNLAQRQL